MAYDEMLAERVGQALGGGHKFEAKKMMGGLFNPKAKASKPRKRASA